MYLFLLSVMGVTAAVNARDCLHPKPMNNFSMEKFQGPWYALSYHTTNKTDNTKYSHMMCIVETLKAESGDHFISTVNFTLKHKPNAIISSVGKYLVPDPSTAKWKLDFQDFPELNIYTFEVLWTDYENFAVAYLSTQFEPGKCSEFIEVLGRDRSRFSDAVTVDEVRKSVEDHLQTPVAQLKPHTQSDCPGLEDDRNNLWSTEL